MNAKISESIIKEILEKPFELEDFDYDNKNREYLEDVIRALNKLREMYIKTEDESYMITILILRPTSYKHRANKKEGE